jgi:hypothetical protein
MNYWWVNQNQTYRTEVRGGFLWSPKTRSDGGKNQFYDNMREVTPGDVIFSFSDTRIKALGIALSRAETSSKPDYGGAGDSWAEDGWRVDVEFQELSEQIRPKDHIEILRPLLPKKYSPLQPSGDGLQSVYLANVPRDLADQIILLIGSGYKTTIDNLTSQAGSEDESANEQEKKLEGRTDIGATTKEQLVKSRRGQGVFRANVRLNEKSCRITKTTNPKHLRASHIKPWKDSTDQEKLSGFNGLMLAPHIDHLFDSGMISFTNEGDLLVSKQLSAEILSQWGIMCPLNVGPFSPDQCGFLEYHRTAVFRQ